VLSSGHAVNFRSSPTVFADTTTPESRCTAARPHSYKKRAPDVTRPPLKQAYYRAMEWRAMDRADQMIDIAFDESLDPAQAELQIDSLKLLMSKEGPKRYGKPAKKPA
jgi:hypothetical protein